MDVAVVVIGAVAASSLLIFWPLPSSGATTLALACTLDVEDEEVGAVVDTGALVV
jgi:hypothetical protein